MSDKQWEVYAAYGGLTTSHLAAIMGDSNLNPFTQGELLASALAMSPHTKEAGREHYRSLIQDSRNRRIYDQVQIAGGLAWLDRLGLQGSPFEGFGVMPRYSFALDLRFHLARPYLSRDDDAFYIIDNPVRKDKVFKVPFVSPTSWKGSLRAAATQGMLNEFAALLPAKPPADDQERELWLEQAWEARARRVVLFGNEKQNDADFVNKWLAPRVLARASGADGAARRKQVEAESKRLDGAFDAYLKENRYRTDHVDGRQGRLFFFPTFFDKIDLEILNPHGRKNRVGKIPIYFECVPKGATGTFRLLYVPYDFPGEVTPDETELCKQVKADLPLVAEAVHDLLLIYGFGAKTSSGFGTAEHRPVTGQLQLNCLEANAGSGGGPSESLVRRLLLGDPLEHRLDKSFFVDGRMLMLSNDEVRQQPWSGGLKAQYRRVKPRVDELLAGQPRGPVNLASVLTDLSALPTAAHALAEKIGGAA